MSNYQTVDIDWQRVLLNLRRVESTWKTARETGLSGQHLQRIADGRIHEPRFNSGLKLLNRHHQLCHERHNLEGIGV